MDRVGTYYFIGIGGIGMSSIAKYLLANNFKVGGYDLTKTVITKSQNQIDVLQPFQHMVAINLEQVSPLILLILLSFLPLTSLE